MRQRLAHPRGVNVAFWSTKVNEVLLRLLKTLIGNILRGLEKLKANPDTLTFAGIRSEHPKLLKRRKGDKGPNRGRPLSRSSFSRCNLLIPSRCIWLCGEARQKFEEVIALAREEPSCGQELHRGSCSSE